MLFCHFDCERIIDRWEWDSYCSTEHIISVAQFMAHDVWIKRKICSSGGGGRKDFFRSDTNFFIYQSIDTQCFSQIRCLLSINSFTYKITVILTFLNSVRDLADPLRILFLLALMSKLRDGDYVVWNIYYVYNNKVISYRRLSIFSKIDCLFSSICL